MMAAAVDLAESIAQMSPVAIQGTKINMNYSRDHSVEEGLEYMVRNV
jgi:delta(3,5)-delta(2,4)-dienoyl-CoA isomerase